MRKKRRSIFVRVTIRNYAWRRIAEEMGKILIKSTYRWNNRSKFKKWITKWEWPYICNLLHHIKNKLWKLRKGICIEKFNIKIAFNSLKIKKYFSNKDPISNDMKPFLVYIGTFYSFNYTLILLHLFITHHVVDFIITM